ncbi:MAG: glycosyltransferase family 4 protein, partial [Anaerolineae bacterium]|nr:glycosyltransferase family 4 protein [Anaerolineae bacterium]
PEKGVETAIRAMRELILERGHRNIEFSIVGTGPKQYKSILKKMVDEDEMSGKIHFLGHISEREMPSLYQQFDILLVPSQWEEPFSRVILEGMASGLAVISTPCGGTSEAIIDEENGLMFPPGDFIALAGKIDRLILDSNLRQRLAQNGRNTAVERFSETRMLDQIESYLLEIAGVLKQTENSGTF